MWSIQTRMNFQAVGSFPMTDFRRAMLVDKLQQIAQCDPETARRAVEIFCDDPMYVRLDEKMEVMLDWVAAHSFRKPDFSKETLVDRLQRIAHCEPETAWKAVNIFAQDPMYVKLDEKMEVMLDFITAYNISIAGNGEATSSAQGQNEQEAENEENVQYDDLICRWVKYEQLESQQNDVFFDLDEEDEEEAGGISPLKKQKVIHHFGRGPMTGYGVPGSLTVHRQLDEEITGPPFFYFENVSNMPRGDWKSISRHLSGVEPEFTDSKHFTACSRPRGYIHNLPTEGRREISPKPPKTIKELIPATQACWPEWDNRIRLNCILTDHATENVRRKVEELVELWVDKSKPPPDYIRTHLLKLARRFNLVWIKPGILVPLTILNIELVMGYDKDHTRALYHPNDRLKRLGDSFQVHTVGYHLSVLKPLYPRGMSVLSLFSGIGGAEVALQKLGIRLNVVVCVESDERSRRVLAHWWKATNQTGELILEYNDVKKLDRKTLGALLTKVGGFDLVVGGSPCKNFSGLNRCSRDGLAGESSILFFEFPRILSQVRQFMAQTPETKNVRL